MYATERAAARMRAILSVAGLLLVLAGCRRLLAHEGGVLSVGLLIAGCCCCLAAFRGVEADLAAIVPPSKSGPRARPQARLRAALLVAAGVAAAVAYEGAADNRFRLWGVAAWAAAVWTWLLATWPGALAPRAGGMLSTVVRRRVRTHPLASLLAAGMAGGALRFPLLGLALVWFVPVAVERSTGPRATSRWGPARVRTLTALIVIVAAGGMLRLHTLQETPSDPTSDHAEKLLDVGDLLGGEHRVYFPRNTGREPLQFYVTGYGLVRGLGMPLQWKTLQTGTAAVDTLAIVVVFLLARELGGSGVGLIAAALYAVAAWPTINAVVGLRPSYGPLTAGIVLWALLRYLRTGDRRDALLTGCFLGTGLYGYTAFRTVPLAVADVLLVALLLDPRLRGRVARTVGDGALMAVTAAVLATPLLRFALEFPDIFWYRTRTRASDAALDLPGSGLSAVTERLPIFLRNNWHAAQMFHWRGDVAYVNFAPGRPALDLVTGTALLVGLVVAVHRVAALRDARHAALLIALPVFALSSTMALAFPHESPSFSRSSLLGPIVFTLAALGLDGVRRAVSAAVPGQAIGWLLLLPLLAVAVHQNGDLLDAYDRSYRDSIPNTSEVVRAIEGADVVGVDLDHAYLVGAPNWLDHRNVAFELGDISWGDAHNVWPDSPLPDPDDGAPLLFVVKLTDARRLDELRARWPAGVETTIRSASPGKDFVTFVVPATRRSTDQTQREAAALHGRRLPE